METRYLLDTNTVSDLIKGTFPLVRERLASVPISQVCISAITEAELLFGLAQKPEAHQLKRLVHEFLIRVEKLAWDSETAKVYAGFRNQLRQEGKALGSLDLLIAAHSLAANAVLVTRDQAFYNFKHLLRLEDWSK